MNTFPMLYRDVTCGAAAAFITLMLSLTFVQSTAHPPGAHNTLAHATAQIGVTNYTVARVAGHHRLAADKAVDLGGRDAGLVAHELLCAALGACTAITLRMYAERKEWPLRAVTPRRLSGRTADAWQRIALKRSRPAAKSSSHDRSTCLVQIPGDAP